ncbi:MAG: HEAT repeat domain-containing protein [Candidatus Aminicenantes bacterium]|nr:HEAT repeat domain-containing protein [Candidatus Aminicenantes bacterium]
MNEKREREEKLKNKINKLQKKKSVIRLVWLLNSKDSRVASPAGVALGKTGDERAIVPLFNALKNEWKYTRDAAAGGLRILQDTLEGKIHERTINFLFEALKNKKQRNYAQNLLDKIGKRAAKHFIYALKDNDSEIRRFAVSVLGKIKESSAVDLLLQLLKDTDIKIRRGAVAALGEIGDIKAKEPLIEALKDKDSKVRENAAHALDLLGWQNEDSAAIFQYLFAKEDWDELAKLGNLAIDQLILLLKNTKMRRKASTALKHMGETAVEPLFQLMNDESAEIRIAAEKTLAGIHSSKTVQIRKKFEKEKVKKIESHKKEEKARVEEKKRQLESIFDDLFNDNFPNKRRFAHEIFRSRTQIGFLLAKLRSICTSLDKEKSKFKNWQVSIIVDILVEIGNSSSLRIALEAKKNEDPSPEFQWCIGEALKRINEKRY